MKSEPNAVEYWLAERKDDAADLLALIFIGIPMALIGGDRQTGGALGGAVMLALMAVLLVCVGAVCWNCCVP